MTSARAESVKGTMRSRVWPARLLRDTECQVSSVIMSFPQKCCPVKGHAQGGLPKETSIGVCSAFLLGSQGCCQDGIEHLKTVSIP